MKTVSDYSALDFELGETIDILRETVSGFAAAEIVTSIQHDPLYLVNLLFGQSVIYTSRQFAHLLWCQATFDNNTKKLSRNGMMNYNSKYGSTKIVPNRPDRPTVGQN